MKCAATTAALVLVNGSAFAGLTITSTFTAGFNADFGANAAAAQAAWMAAANTFSAKIDLFSYTGPNARGLGDGAGNNFSINNGTTLLKLFNNAAANGLDSRDWAGGSNDAFNQFSNSGVQNPVTPVDVRLLDVLGYDLAAVPEPSTVVGGALLLLPIGASALRMLRRPKQAAC